MKGLLAIWLAVAVAGLFVQMAHAATVPEAVGTGDPAAVSAALTRGADPNESYGGATGLHLAAEWGYREIAELLLKKGAKVDAIDSLRRTPLFWAAENRHEVIARLLLDAGADPNWHDPNGYSVLSNAVEGKEEGLVKYLLADGGAKVAPDDVRALRAAIDTQNAEIVRLLLAAGANPCAKPEKDIGPFYAAAVHGTLEILKLLAEHIGKCPDKAILFDGFAAAAEKGSLPVVEYLFWKKPPHNKMVDALKEAFEDDQSEVARFLIENDSSLTADDKGGFLASALLKRAPGLSQSLIDHGAALDKANAFGQTPLLAACTVGDIERTKFFIEHKATLEARDSDGVTPLLAACRNGSVPIVELLRQHGASLNAIDHEKRGAFLNAAMSGHGNVCEILARHGADVNAIDPANGFSALHYAAANGDLELTKTLLAIGTKRSSKDLEGRTARELAEERGFEEIFDLLVPGSKKSMETSRR